MRWKPSYQRQKEEDTALYLAFLRTLGGVPIFKVQNGSQCGRGRGHRKSKLLIHDALLQGRERMAAPEFTLAPAVEKSIHYLCAPIFLFPFEKKKPIKTSQGGSFLVVLAYYCICL